MVICDIADEDTGEPVEVAPRQILKRQIARAAEKGFVIKTGSELEFYLFRDGYDEHRGRRIPQPAPELHVHHGLPHAADDQGRMGHPPDPQRDARRGHPDRVLEGRVRQGPARDQHHVRDALTTADYHSIYKHGVKEICHANGVAATFMAKWTMDEAGSSCHMHSSVWNKTGKKSLMYDEKGEHHLSETYRHYMGGLIATAREMSYMFAPFVNSYKRYQLGSWAPTAIVWSRDNRTCGFRTVGEHTGARVEDRIPGGDVNPYLGVRGDDRGRTLGDREQDRAAGDVQGQRV